MGSKSWVAKSDDAFAICLRAKRAQKRAQKRATRCTATLRQRRYDARLRHRPERDRCRTLTRLGLLPVISYASLCEIGAGTTKLLGPDLARIRRQKEKAPAVAGPGLSCRGVTTILADRDAAT
jgi:hypothetical protein